MRIGAIVGGVYLLFFIGLHLFVFVVNVRDVEVIAMVASVGTLPWGALFPMLGFNGSALSLISYLLNTIAIILIIGLPIHEAIEIEKKRNGH